MQACLRGIADIIVYNELKNVVTEALNERQAQKDAKDKKGGKAAGKKTASN